MLKLVYIAILLFLPSRAARYSRQRTAAKKPNIVYIMADDLGWNDVGFHNPKVRTPNIDWLANNGIELTDSHVQQTCSPSRSALLTGKYPSNNGLQLGPFPPQPASCLPVEHKIISEYMKEEGYATKYVGKWHLGYCDASCLPTNRGFDEFRGIVTGEASYFNWTVGDLMVHYINDQPSVVDIGTHLTIQDGRYVEDIISSHDPSVPLFMILSPTAPHTPLEVTDEMFGVHDFLSETDPEESERRKFLGLVSALDDLVGTTIQALRDAGIFDNTVIVFTSDNGGTALNIPIPGVEESAVGNNYPLRGSKNMLYEGGTRVPTIYFDPRLNPSTKGTKRDFLMYISDWLPTFVSIGSLGRRRVRGIDGLNQVINLRNKYSSSRSKYHPRQELLVGLTDFGGAPEQPCAVADGSYRWRNWKLIYGNLVGRVTAGDTEWVKPIESPEVATITGDSCMRFDSNGNMVIRCLFDLDNDISETNNLFDAEPRIVNRLLRRLDLAKCESVENVGRFPRPNSDETTRQLGEFLVPRNDYCFPSTDFPLIPQDPSCVSDIFCIGS